MMPATTEPLVEATREFTFAQPAWLWALPLVLVLLFLRRRPGTTASLAHPTIRFAAASLRRPATLAGRIGPICMALTLAALIIALARPQWKTSTRRKA